MKTLKQWKTSPLSTQILAWLAKNPPATAQTIAAHLGRPGSKTTEQTNRCLRELREALEVEIVDEDERPFLWQIKARPPGSVQRVRTTPAFAPNADIQRAA